MKPPRLFQPRSASEDALGVLASALGLVAFGLICLYSLQPDLVLRQAIWAALGIAACLIVSRVPLDRLRDAATPLLVAVGVLLAAALAFAEPVANTQRWMQVPIIGQFQPSELAKIAIVLYMAHRLADVRGRVERPFHLAWPVLAVCMLVLPAPDFGTTIYLGVVAGTMLIVGGVRLGRLATITVASVPLLLFAAARFHHVQQRLQFFAGHRSYQQVQAELALGSGGLFGNGLGWGWQKHHYLPAGHTDFILANIGEELGFLGVCVVCALFLLILVHGARVALAAVRRDRFAFYLAAGATFTIVFQAVLNIAVATGAAPTKGISLPFLSQGGSNLFVSLLAVGLIVNVGRSLEVRR